MQKWFEDFSKEMPTIQNLSSIHGQCNIYQKQKSVCQTITKSNRGYSETKASYNDQRLLKPCRYGKFCQIVLPQTSKTFEAHIRPY